MTCSLDPGDLDRLLREVIPAVVEAGDRALAHQKSPRFEVETKSDGSPVTVADREAEQLLRDRLGAHPGDFGILGEEFGDGSRPGRPSWIIDPIDGTRAFTRGQPYWATLLALVDGDESLLGIVYAPALGTLAWARRGGGAWVNGRPTRVSAVSRLEEAFLSFGSLEQLPGKPWGGRAFELMGRAWTTRGYGDATAYLQLVTGRIDAMIETGVNLWDIAPMMVLVEEAGGRYSDLAGRRDGRDETFMASNGAVHPAILQHLAGSSRL